MHLPLLGTLGLNVRPLGGTATGKNVPDASLVGAYDAILNTHVPPSLLINERRELLHSFGGAERFLSIKGGRPTHDVLDMLDHDLRTAVTGAVQCSLKDNIPITFSALCMTTHEGEQRLRVAVKPLNNPRTAEAIVDLLGAVVAAAGDARGFRHGERRRHAADVSRSD